MSLSVKFTGHAGGVPSDPGTHWRTGMEALIALFVILTPWFVLDLVADRHGVDSRDTLPDDHHR